MQCYTPCSNPLPPRPGQCCATCLGMINSFCFYSKLIRIEFSRPVVAETERIHYIDKRRIVKCKRSNYSSLATGFGDFFFSFYRVPMPFLLIQSILLSYWMR